jgi:hypothetical protein
MNSPDRDSMGHTLGERLRGLGLKGVLWQMAERGQIIELACEMPRCYCPKGRSWFETRATSKDWAPNTDHYPILRSKQGYRLASNVRLAHVLCNVEDASLRARISTLLKAGKSLQQIADALNQRKRRAPLDSIKWIPALVRTALVS